MAGSPASWGIEDAINPNNLSWETVLDKISQIGLKALELGPYGYMPQNLNLLIDALTQRKLWIVAGMLYDDLVAKDNFNILEGKTILTCKLISSLPKAVPAAAREFGHSVIDAHIIEYLPSKDTLENILYREKADFIWKTGLPDSINLTEVGQYAYLMEQILDHQYFMEEIAHEPIPLKKVAEDWYRTIYRPLIRIIRQNQLIKAFPKRTITDLYAYVSYHQWKKGRRKRQYNIGIDDQIPKSMERFRAKMMDRKVLELPEMKRTAKAFLLINVETGKENRIMGKLYAQKEVQEVHIVPGDYDIIVKIAVERDLIISDSEVIGHFVQNIVRRMPGVVKTNTIIPISSKQKLKRE
jgi:DNA-binding Lrp family transcriptional regulator